MNTATRALVRRPSPRLAEGEVTHVARQPLDVPLAREQHAAYLQVLRAHGLLLIELPELPDHPDAVFVEDTLVMLDGRALLTRPGAASRRGELESVEATLRMLRLPLERIQAPATLDGGDVLVLSRHVLVGQSTRTDAAALEQLAALVRGTGRVVVSVEVRGMLHLKSAITALPNGTLIAVPDAVDSARLRALGYPVQYAVEPSAGDVLCLGQTVVLPLDAPETARALRHQGFEVVCVDIGELQKIEAGVTCMSVLL
ncbi:MAG: Dimethylargininase [Myxococcaceae bacterium]|nr:Dimethylargininase [Myxococcaceae bacterium]